MEVVNHKLKGDNVEWVEATSYGKNVTIIPDTIIIHYTAGPSGSSTVKLFSASNAKLSAHLVAAEDGKITQMVPFDKKGYHAGTSEYGGRSNFNGFSIGIEISNPGYLTKNPKGAGYVTWWEAQKDNPKPVAADMVYEGTHRNAVTKNKYWYKYTDVQIAAVKTACEAICAAYKIKYILGHEEVAPGRKSDPGPAFPLDELRNEIFNVEVKPVNENLRDVVTPTNVIKTGTVLNKLNFRATADPEGAKLTAPLEKDTKVSIVKEEGDWYKIVYKIKGWAKRDAVAHDNTDTDTDADVVVDKLVLRAEANDKAVEVINPLKKGDPLFTHDQLNNYILVSAMITGYVAKKYVKA